MQRIRSSASLLIIGVSCHASLAHAQLDCTDTTPIYTIQGASHVSPYQDQTVNTCGVVTAVAYGGYYLQDATGDGNEATSDGIYVVQRGDKPAVGTQVKISATVSEYIAGGSSTGNLPLTSLVSAELLESMLDMPLPEPLLIGQDGRSPPTEIVISDSEVIGGINLQNAEDATSTPFNPDVDAIDFYESLEGMLVSIADPVAVSGTRQFGTFSAEVFVLADRGQFATPSDNVARTPQGGILLQPHRDNRGDQNPERLQIQFDGTLYGSTNYPAIKTGDTLNTVNGVMGYSFGNFEIMALGPVTLYPISREPDVTRIKTSGEESDSDISISSYNVLNLSAVDDDNDQRTLIASHVAISLQQPDIIALQEVQDNNGDGGNCPSDDTSACSGVLDASETLQRLADAIVAQGGPEYHWINVDPLVETTNDNRDNVDTFGGAAFGNIRNAYLYNPTRVSLVNYQGLTRDVLTQRGVTNPLAFDGSRDPLEAVFEFNGEQVTVLNNHFSSRFGSSPIFGGPQPFVQAGEESRSAQSLAINQVVAAHLEQDSTANVVVLGDFNTFEFTDELSETLPISNDQPILFNLIDVAGTAPYSYNFEGNSQSLDHIFVSAKPLETATADYVNVNSNSPRLFSTTVGSDHDPVIARFSMGNTLTTNLDLRTTVYSKTALELFWNRSSLINSYNVFRDGTLVSDSNYGVSFFEDALQPNTVYEYEVRGYSGESLIASERQSVRTQAAVDGSATVAVEQLTGSVYSSSALEIFWSVPEHSAPDNQFEIYRDELLMDTFDGRSFFDSGLAAATSYTYTVTTIGQNGDRSSSVSIDLITRD